MISEPEAARRAQETPEAYFLIASKSIIEEKQSLLKVLPATTNSIKIKHRRQTIK